MAAAAGKSRRNMKVAVQGRVERRRFGHFITKQRKSSSSSSTSSSSPTSSCPYLVDHQKSFFSSSTSTSISSMSSSSSNTTIRPQWWLPPVPPPHHNHQPTGPTPTPTSPPQHKEVDEGIMALVPVDIKHFLLLPRRCRGNLRTISDPPQHYPPPLRLLEEANDEEWIYIESGIEYINKEEEGEEKVADEEELLAWVPVDIKNFILLPSRSNPRIPSDPPQHYPPPLRLLQEANDEEWIYLEGGIEKYETHE